ncbi:ubiquitin-associated domain-containing protein [Proteiniborus sp. DW1]|uniref:DUF4342 domain-containing protein n=1 Tax=Proteiniborus sp. DW1 TaxID=1889883 RepID=UPI00092E17BB|nr:DUF4342 domain-containing protein [Proteiniborus sp. DW1]SCG83603.1 ubiquitin-associated domain-containing protein [Proteiniborus sp. DW1]
MDINLESIDIIRERTGVSYKEAKEVLEKHNGDVLEALIELEENKHSWSDNLSNKGEEIIETLREILRKGNVTKIVVKKDGETIVNLPVTAGAIGVILALPLTALGLTAAVISKCSIEITREDGEVININEMAEKTVDKVKKGFKKDDRFDSNTQNFSDENETED